MVVSFIIKIENIVLKNIYTLKKSAKTRQCFIFTLIDVLFAQNHIWQTIKNVI